MIDAAVKQAMHEGVLAAVREATANDFNVYRQGAKESGQQERTANGLIRISNAAQAMLELIDELCAGPKA